MAVRIGPWPLEFYASTLLRSTTASSNSVAYNNENLKLRESTGLIQLEAYRCTPYASNICRYNSNHVEHKAE